MRRKIEPLLCELHAHTRWRDGALTVPELVDLYGRNGFDVLCVTDHVNRSDDPWSPADVPFRGVHAANHAAERGLPAVASGDFHLPEHLPGWKTLLPCAKDERAVVDYLRSPRPAFLTRIEPVTVAAARRAA